MATGTRDRIIGALRAQLAAGGPGDVTLDSVAAAAGVSKGGLLYHFPSKAALYEGLLEQVRDTVRHDMEQAAGRSGAARGFLEYSSPSADDEVAFFTSLIAAVRTGQSGESEAARARAQELLTQTFTEWEQPLRDVVADPVRAETIRLVGYGIYLAALAGLPPVDPDLLRRVFDRLLADAAAPINAPATTD